MSIIWRMSRLRLVLGTFGSKESLAFNGVHHIAGVWDSLCMGIDIPIRVAYMVSYISRSIDRFEQMIQSFLPLHILALYSNRFCVELLSHINH
jgi:hypothetical protein